MSVRFSWMSDRVREALDLPAGEERRAFRGVSTDSRTTKSGDLFVALPGERFDGTDFVADAAEAGAVGAVVERYPGDVPEDLELFIVDDAQEALGALAHYRRRYLDPRVIGVTGTSGKTTTRELIAAVLGPEAYSSPGNYNNLIGLPLAILGAPETAPVWVLELASNQPGEIRRLGEIAEPDCGVITTVGEAHLEGLGDLAGVLEEKLSLLDTVRPEGVAVVGDSPPELSEAARAAFAHVVVAGLEPEAGVRPESWSVSAHGLRWRWHGVEFRTDMVGTHILRNAMLALAVADWLGVPAQEAAPRVHEVRPLPMRNEVRGVGQMTLLIDCYNANPGSFGAAIDVSKGLADRGRRVAVVGTMLELGGESRRLHSRVAREIAAAGFDLVVATGQFVEAFAPMVESCGDRLILEEDPMEAYPVLAERLTGDEVVLLKASRGIELERLVPLFERDFGDRDSEEVLNRQG